MSLLKVSDLEAGYNQKEVLREINFSVNEGDFLGIIGPNSSGKSTLLRCLSRVLPPFKGEVLLNGEDIYKLKAKEVAKSIAMVPQDTVVSFAFSVEEIVLMGRTPYLSHFGQERKRDFLIARASLRQTNSLHLSSRLINELSAGERQKVIIAKALSQEPEVLFLDEPTSHLDINHQIEVFDLLKKLNKEEGLTVVAVSHDLNLAALYCEELILLKEGGVFASGRVEKVLTKENIRKVYNCEVEMSPHQRAGVPQVVLLPRKIGRSGK